MAAAFRMFFLFPPFYLLFCYLLLYLLQKKKSTANMIKNYGILTFLDLLQAWYKKRKVFITFFEGSLFNTYRVLRTINPSPYMFYFSGTDVEVAGSAIIKLIEKYGADAPEYVAEYVKSMKEP